MKNSPTIIDSLLCEYHEIKSKSTLSEWDLRLALQGNSGIVSITVALATGETTTVDISDLIAHHWNAIKLQEVIQEWCKDPKAL